ncbi:hypothetical protein TNCV_171061 [Trichonephila clavipes]|nr:hypothetical protein TNCV_171061 [Trichonephila clavipes]
MGSLVVRSSDSRPEGLVVSDADCGAVGSGFEYRVKHECLCCNPSLCEVCFTLTSMNCWQSRFISGGAAIRAQAAKVHTQQCTLHRVFRRTVWSATVAAADDIAVAAFQS